VESDPKLLFEAQTPLGFTVRVTLERRNLITTLKHPIMVGREAVVKDPTDAIKEGTQIWPK